MSTMLRLLRALRFSIADIGDPQRYVHLFFDECRRPQCYCHRGLSRGEKGAYFYQPTETD